MMVINGGCLSCSLSALKVSPKSSYLSLSSILESERRFLVKRSYLIMMSILLLSLETSTTVALDVYPSFLCQNLIGGYLLKS